MQPSCPVPDSSPIRAILYPGVSKLGLFGVLDERLYGIFHGMCKLYSQVVNCFWSMHAYVAL